MNFKFLSLFFIFVLGLYACSVEISQPPSAIVSGTNTAESLANITPAVTVMDIPTAETLTPEVNVIPTPTAGKVPITWSNLNLTGKLIYTFLDITGPTIDVLSLDLATGELHTVIQLPVGGWADAAAVSPDHNTLMVAYSPPQNDSFGGQQSLYARALDRDEPLQLVVTPSDHLDQYSQPQWSPDGKYIYMAHINFQSMDTYEILRMAYPSGNPERLTDRAYWPRASDDGKRLIYISFDADTGRNHLILANPDGTEAHSVPLTGLPVPQIIDVPMISPDNRFILFSSPDGLGASAPNWLDKLFGVGEVFADGSLPSDWWSVPISGGAVTRLTNLQSLALYGAYSPDQKFVASYSASGIFVMKPNGTDLTMIINDVGGAPGTVNWLP